MKAKNDDARSRPHELLRAALLALALGGATAGCGEGSGRPADPATGDAVLDVVADAIGDAVAATDGAATDSVGDASDSTGDAPDADIEVDLTACEAAAARTAFVHATVLPMTGASALEDTTVVVGDGRICAVFPSGSVELPADTTLIDATGRTLLPGLADMHVHFNQPDDALLYVANGVTTIRTMWGFPWVLEVRERIAAGEVTGPAVYTTGPLTDGSPPYWPSSVVVTTAEEARAQVLAQAEAGYDAFKVYSRLNVESYEAITATASEIGLPVMGHVPEAVGLEGVLDTGVQTSVEHLLGYDMVASDGTLEARTAKSGIWNCPTLVVYDRYARVAALQADPPDYVRAIHPAVVESWMQAQPYEPYPAGAMAAKVHELHELGAPLLVGTDTANPFVAPGFALHDELEMMVDAGLAAEDVLRMATADAARYLGWDDRKGTIEAGKDADLLLLEGDPRADIARTRDIAGVMVMGRWLLRSELDAQVEALAESYEATYGLDVDCGMPDEMMTPPATDHAVFRVAGELGTFGDAGAWAARSFDVVLDGQPVAVGNQSALVTVEGFNWALGVHAFSYYEPLGDGHVTYRYFNARIPATVIEAAATAKSGHIAADAASVTLSRMELKTVGADTYVKMCTIAVSAEAEASSLWICDPEAFSLKLGAPVRLSGNVELTTDPATILSRTSATDPCACWKAPQEALTCAAFDAAGN